MMILALSLSLVACLGETTTEATGVEASQTPENNFYYVNERYVTLMYNTDMIDNRPTSYADLTDEAYKGMVVIADGTQSATA